MLPPMTAVYSSHVSRIGYDAATRMLFVEWDTGKVSSYANVPPDIAQEAQSSWSIGKYLHDTVKPNFRHEYVL